MLGGLIIHARDQAGAVIRHYRDFMTSAPDELTAYAGLLCTPDGAPAVGVIACYCGDPATGARVLQPLRAFGTPLADTIQPIPFPAMQTTLDGAFPDHTFNYWKSTFVRDGAPRPCRASQPLIRSFLGSYHAVSCALAGTRSQATSTSSSCPSSQRLGHAVLVLQIAHARAGAPTRWPYMPEVTEPTIRPSGPDRLLVVEQLRCRPGGGAGPGGGWACRPRGRGAARRGRETARLVPGDAEAEAGGERVVLGADVVAPVAVALLGAAGVHGVVAGVGQPELPAGLDDPVEDVGRELGRDVELPAQLADIGDPAGADPGVADLQLARGARTGRRRWTGPRPTASPAARASAAPSGRASAGPR